MNLLILFGKRNVTLLFAWETQQNIVMGNMYSCQSVYYFYTTKKHHQITFTFTLLQIKLKECLNILFTIFWYALSYIFHTPKPVTSSYYFRLLFHWTIKNIFCGKKKPGPNIFDVMLEEMKSCSGSFI